MLGSRDTRMGAGYARKEPQGKPGQHIGAEPVEARADFVAKGACRGLGQRATNWNSAFR